MPNMRYEGRAHPRRGLGPDAFLRDQAAALPLRRVAEPERVTAAIAFFCSDAARHVTGQTLYVLGGP